MSTSLKDYQQVRGLAIQSLFEIIEQSSEGTVIVDRDANIVWMNERYAKRFGLKSADQAIGQPCEQVISNSLLRQVVRNDRPILLDIQDTPKGPRVVMRLPIHDEAGAVIGAGLGENARAALESSDYGYVLETGEVALSGDSASLARDERVQATYLGGGSHDDD